MLRFKNSLLSLTAFLVLLLVPSLSFAETPYETPYATPETSYVTPAESQEYIQRNEPFIKSKVGMGVHALGFYQSPIRLTNGDCLETQVFGGAGWYLKFRTGRYVTIEFVNDYLYAKYQDQFGDMLKVPITLGLRFHVLDYGRWDIYGAAAFSLNVVALLSGGKVEDMMGDNLFLSAGGQFGAGIAHIFPTSPGCEIGLDVRYTIEQAPKVTMYDSPNKHYPIHGVLFSLTIGMAFW